MLGIVAALLVAPQSLAPAAMGSGWLLDTARCTLVATARSGVQMEFSNDPADPRLIWMRVGHRGWGEFHPGKGYRIELRFDQKRQFADAMAADVGRRFVLESPISRKDWIDSMYQREAMSILLKGRRVWASPTVPREGVIALTRCAGPNASLAR